PPASPLFPYTTLFRSIVRDPVIVESGSNDTPKTAQSIALPAAVCGTIEKNEDVDYFRFHVEAGEALVFHVRCARLEDRIHDLQTDRKSTRLNSSHVEI